MLAEQLIWRGWEKQQPVSDLWIFQSEESYPLWEGGSRPKTLSFDLRSALHMKKGVVHLLISFARHEVVKLDREYSRSFMQKVPFWPLIDFYSDMDKIAGLEESSLKAAAKRPKPDDKTIWNEVRVTCG